MKNEKDLYFVALKVFLEDQKQRLLIIKDRFGDWDLPGGRLKENDFNVALEQVLQRKVKEELGDAVRYDLSDPIVYMRHERNEVLPSGERSKRRIFAVAYKAQYLSGDIVLGKNHEKYEWVDTEHFDPNNYFTGGWLKGVEEYLRKIHSREVFIP